MKKLLVLSDSHGERDCMERIVREEQPDLIYHLGDYLRDSEWLRAQFFHIPVFGVVGNCDYGCPGPEKIVDAVEDVRIFACHGHNYHVKYGLMALKFAAQEQHAALCLFGHTHVPCLEESGGITFLNPGACGKMNRSYGIVLLSGGTATCSLHRSI